MGSLAVSESRYDHRDSDTTRMVCPEGPVDWCAQPGRAKPGLAQGCVALRRKALRSLMPARARGMEQTAPRCPTGPRLAWPRTAQRRRAAKIVVPVRARGLAWPAVPGIAMPRVAPPRLAWARDSTRSNVSSRRVMPVRARGEERVDLPCDARQMNAVPQLCVAAPGDAAEHVALGRVAAGSPARRMMCPEGPLERAALDRAALPGEALRRPASRSQGMPGGGLPNEVVVPRGASGSECSAAQGKARDSETPGRGAPGSNAGGNPAGRRDGS